MGGRGATLIYHTHSHTRHCHMTRTNTLLERLVDLECDTLNLEIETMRKIQNFKQDINLLQIDDDHPSPPQV